MKFHSRPHAFLTTILAGAIVLTTVCVSQLSSPVQASAANADQWDPSMIISDSAFYNTSAMSQAQIAAFLATKGAGCVAGSAPCLKDYTQTTSNVAADKYCAAYKGAANESAAQILWKVGQACGINPQVLIVTLQKETSLVTATKPSTGAYQTAMGFGCPDSAACNTAYYGFFNQLYRAARQFQVYAANPNLFSYRAGVANNIAYNPKNSCGSSSVVIQNQATASLYNYTPYQPNAAALANLYGTGDSCSAYGNRNFWTYFTDWFGSPSLPWASGTLIGDPTANKVYFVNGDQLIYLDSFLTSTALGVPSSVQMVTHASLSGVTIQPGALRPIVVCGGTTYAGIGGQLRQLNTAQTGTLPSTTLATSACAALPKGPALTSQLFVTSPSTGRVYQFAAGAKLYMHSLAQMLALSPSALTTTWPDTMINTVSDRYPTGTLVGDQAANKVFLVDGDQLIYLDSFTTSTALGIASTAPSIDDATVVAYTPIEPGFLRPVVTCGTTTYAGIGGQLRAIDPSKTGALASTPLATTTCAALTKGATLSGQLFVKSPSSPKVYQVTNGTLVYMSSWNQMLALDSSPVIATWPDSMLAPLPQGLPSGTLVGDAYANRVYYVTGGALTYLDSFATTQALGIPSTITEIDHSTAAAMTITPAPLRPVVTCGTTTYAGVGGQVRAIKTSVTGVLPSTALDAAACATLPKGAALTGQLFVKASGNPDVYLLTNGVKVYMSTWKQVLAIDAKPVLATWPASQVSAIPTGMMPGTLIGDATANRVYLSNANQLVYLDSFVTSSALGIPSTVTMITHTAVTTYPVAGANLRPVVTCGSTTYAGVGGALRAINTTKTGKLAATALATTTCAAMPKGAALNGQLFVKSSTSPRVYQIAGGKKIYMTSLAQMVKLDPKPVIATWSDAAVNAIPNGG